MASIAGDRVEDVGAGAVVVSTGDGARSIVGYCRCTDRLWRGRRRRQLFVVMLVAGDVEVVRLVGTVHGVREGVDVSGVVRRRVGRPALRLLASVL